MDERAIDITNEISNYITRCMKTVGNGSFRNVTPYMGGDYRGRTFVYGLSRRARFVGLPTAQAIKSRARYASLLALASFLENPNSYKDVYHSFKVKTRVGEVPLLGLIYGCVNCIEKSAEAFASPFKLFVEVSGNPIPWSYNGKDNRYHALLSRSRDRNLKYQLKPVEPKRITLTIKYMVEDNRLRMLGFDDQMIRAMEDVFEKSIEFALFILGIGKGATRGFGRFWVDEPRCSDVSEVITSFIDKWKALLNKLYAKGLLTTQIAPPFNVIKTPINGKVPHIGFLYDLASNNLLCNSLLKRVHGSVDHKIERIGSAVLKLRWKQIGSGNMRVSGLKYHTWPLGLPRRSKIRCTCGKRGKESSNWYGYMLVLAANALPDNFCEHSNLCGGNYKVNTKEGRRTSMIHLMPVQEGVLVIPMLANDMKEYVLGTNKGGYVLYHVGGHFFIGKRPCCNRHFVKVGFILNNANIPPPANQPRRPSCGCRGDSGGIRLPPRSFLGGIWNRYPLNRNRYEMAIRSAIEWVFNAL